MTSQQFLDSIKQNYALHAKQAACNIPDNTANTEDNTTALGATGTKNAGEAILTPTKTSGVAAQQGDSPMKTFLNFEEAYPNMLQRANNIANLDERDATLKSLEQQHSIYQAGATAWKQKLMSQAQTLAIDPHFTDIGQIPPDMVSALSDSPATMQYLEGRAKYNIEHGSGMSTKDNKEYGKGISKALSDTWTGDMNIDKVHKLYADGEITVAGVDRLSKELSRPSTPESESEKEMKKTFFSGAKTQISGKNEMLGIRDPKGEMLYSQYLMHALPAYDAGRAEGKTPSQLLDEKSPDYIGKSISSFKRTSAQMAADMINDSGEVTATGVTPSENDIAYLKANPSKKEQFEKHFGAGSSSKVLFGNTKVPLGE